MLGHSSLSMPHENERQTGQSSLDFAFPPQLKDTLNRLYQLRRGQLISPGPMRSMDDRAEIRGLFLRFPLEECIQMMAPSMWSTGDIASSSSTWDVMQPVPAETLALWDGVSGQFTFAVHSQGQFLVWQRSDLVVVPFHLRYLFYRASLQLTSMIHCLFGVGQIVRDPSMMGPEKNSKRFFWNVQRIDFQCRICTF
jgi:hypothetical protein